MTITELDVYRSRLGALVMETLPLDADRLEIITSMATEQMLQRAMDNETLWRIWNNKMKGYVYPPGDPRNPKN